MKDEKQTASISIPMKRSPSSSSTIAPSTFSHATTNDDPADSVFSRSPTNSTCNSTINSSSMKDDTSTRSSTTHSRTSSLLHTPQPERRRRRRSFRETASQLIPSSSRGRSPPKSKPSSPTSSTGSAKTTRRSKSIEHAAHHQNVYTYSGRHSDDWLFGGFSVTGSIKKVFEKKDKK